MYTITIGKISKRPNSTSTYMTDAMSLTVELKEDVSLAHPVFIVEGFDPTDYNYLSWQIQERGIIRYYHIKTGEITFNGLLYEIPCELDRLATYKNDILQSYARIKYCNGEGFWDQYYDDLRFSPSNLDTYSFFSFTDDNRYLWKSSLLMTDDGFSNVDIDDGCYVMVVDTRTGTIGTDPDKRYLGPRAVAMNTAKMNTFLRNIGGISQLVVDYRSHIKSCIWLPIRIDKLLDKIDAKNVDDLWISGVQVIENVWFIGMPCIVNWTNYIEIPREKSAVPIWMNNDRWNDLQLYTPGGYVTLNLDYMYPKNHDKLHYSNTLDVLTGQLDVKFTYDNKEGFSDQEATIAYETTISYGMDAMYIFERNIDSTLSTEWMHTATSMAPAIGTALAGPAGAAVGSAVGGVVNKMVPQANRTSSEGYSTTSYASLFNTSSIDMVRLRFKPFRCKDLASDASETSAYPTPYAKYLHYCEQYGFPVNQYGKIDDFWWKRQEDGTYIMTESADVKGITPGISTEDINYLNKALDAGIWLR